MQRPARAMSASEQSSRAKLRAALARYVDSTPTTRPRPARTGAQCGGGARRNARHHGAVVALCARQASHGDAWQHACRHRRQVRETCTRDGRGASTVRTARGVSAALWRGADVEKQALLGHLQSK